MTTDVPAPQDPWADWLLRGRQQGMSDAQVRRQRRQLEGLRDRTLRGARLHKGQRVLDVGAGTGLLALEACRRVGPGGSVCGLDISRAALQEAQRLANRQPAAAPLTTVVAGAEALPFADASFDTVLTRSVLIYVADKTAAAREFYRVLKPGGRVSIFEPINSAARKFEYGHGGLDISAVQPEYDRVWTFARAQWPHQAAMMDFDERDLVRWFVEAGFNIHLTYEYGEGRGPQLTSRRQARRREDVAAGLARRYNPTLMSYAEAATAVLAEAADEHLRRFVDLIVTQPRWSATGAAYLVARRPKP